MNGKLKNPPPAIWYGGDWNPDQWPDDILEADLRLFAEARINTVALPVFSWAKLQPAPERWDFAWLDRIMDRLAEAGLGVILATSTAAQPAWMCRLHPEMMPVDVDGRRRNHGKRVNFCPSSPVYRRHAAELARRMAERYGRHPGLRLWHIANEYGTHCFCETCAAAFRLWLRERYGTVEELNRRWNLAFWGHTVYDWDEVNAPSELNDDNKWYQPKMLDYLRFQTDASLGCYLAEYAVLKAATPDIPVTTNISGLIKSLDQHRFAPYFDVVAWDNYPQPADAPSFVALKHGLMRGLKDGQSFILAEQTPSQQNWQPYNRQKRPGEMRLLSYQALAHGADSVLFFQLRASVGGVEKFHGAVIGHSGHGDTRVFRECAQLGRELESLGGQFLGARSDARVAIVFDWDAWWAVELSSGPSVDLKYLDQVHAWYRACHEQGIAADIVRQDADLSDYKLVIAPLQYLLKPGAARRYEDFVASGGRFVATVFSGIVDQNDLVLTGGYPAELRKLLGLWVEEYDALLPGTANRLLMRPDPAASGGAGQGDVWAELPAEAGCGLLCGLVRPSGCRTLAVYGDDYYADSPCLTEHRFGRGLAYQVATHPEASFIGAFVAGLCRRAGIWFPGAGSLPAGVELARRQKDGRTWTFVLNHHARAVKLRTDHLDEAGRTEWRELISNRVLQGEVELPPRGIAILVAP